MSQTQRASTPYRDRVTGIDLPLLREVAAALLILGGLVTLVVIAFRVSDLLGAALLAVLSIGLGFALALAPRQTR